MTSDSKPTPSAARLWIARGLLSAGSLAVALLVARAWLGAVEPPRSVYEPDDELLYRLGPGSAKTFRFPGEPDGPGVPVRINELGFRGEDFPLDEARPRVLVYGDSFVAAEFSPLEETFVHQLQVELTRRLDRPVRAVNAGVVGYGPDQVLLRLDRDLPRVTPDLVLVVLYPGNDYGDLMRNHLVRLGPDGGLVRRHPRISDELRARWASEASAGPIEEFRRIVGGEPRDTDRPRRIPTAEEFLERALSLAEREFEDVVERDVGVITQFWADHHDADIALDPDSPPSRYKLALMEQVVAAIADRCAAAGTPVAFVHVPALLDVCPDAPFAVDTGRHPTYDPARLCRLLDEMVRREGAPSLDLQPVFREAGGCALYFANGDQHWNGAGRSLAARTVAAFLLGEGPLADALARDGR